MVFNRESKVFLIGDTHFWHYNIIRYCNRPFDSVAEMNDALVDRWNDAIGEDDTVIHLGDFSHSGMASTMRLIGDLKGYKILLRGNHDKSRSITKWLEAGFHEVYNGPMACEYHIKDRIIPFYLSHEPYRDAETQRVKNIHAHTHNNPTGSLSEQRYKCVSVELIEYKPIRIRELEGWLARMKGDNNEDSM